MALLKRMWNAPATAGMAFVAAATALATAWAIEGFTDSELYAFLGGLIWALLWLWWDIRHPDAWGRQKISN